MSRNRRQVLSIAAVLSCLLQAAACAKRPSPGDPLRGLTHAQQEQFERGRAVFQRVFVPEKGLGPLFNGNACGECHEDPAPGGFGDEVETHVAVVAPDGSCDPLVEKGGPVIQQHVTPALKAALGIDSEPVPLEAHVRAMRTSPDILGFGLLDAIPDEVILARTDPDDRDHDGISGRPNRFVDGRLGRFGRKGLVPTLVEFNEGAFVVEQGITNPAAPTEESVGGSPLPAGVDPTPEPELSAEDLRLANAFVRFLAPPAPRHLNAEARYGRRLFTRIGCASCHLPELRTGSSDIAALRYKNVAAYTDLLLHDMGPDLADICLGLAAPSEFRTEPLMGVGRMPHFLHDGRATNLGQAVELHGGEAAAARDRFAALSSTERAALLRFLGSL